MVVPSGNVTAGSVYGRAPGASLGGTSLEIEERMVRCVGDDSVENAFVTYRPFMASAMSGYSIHLVS